jgi:hypothetical protein
MVSGLTGRAATYENPGIALRSYVVAHCLSREFVQLNGEILKEIHECEEFTKDSDVIGQISETLLKNATAIIEKISQLSAEHQVKLQDSVQTLNKHSATVSSLFSIYIENVELDDNSYSARNLRDSLIDLHEAILDVEWRLDKLAPSPDCA